MVIDRLRSSPKKIGRVWSVGIKCNVCHDPGVLYVRVAPDGEGKIVTAVKLADGRKDGHWEEVVIE